MDETTDPKSNTSPESETGEAFKSDIAAEFLALGKNLKDVFQTAWESEERKKIQLEIETALAEMIASLSQAANEFRESPAGQRLETDVEDLRTRVKTGEMGSQIRTELLTVLRRVNADLEKAAVPKGESPETGNSDSPEEV